MIDKIYHVADIHIRNVRRHKEYQEVFELLYKYIEETKTENSVIYLAGDIVHSKNEMTPELVAMVSGLFKRCSELLPTVIITGNHDTNLNNENRLDALSPIVDSLALDNIHYWKDSGVYNLNGVAFSVFSVYGPEENWVPASEMSGNYKIALHHGAVNSAVTDLNHEIKNDNVGPNIFRGFDLALLGDIHKRQFLNDSQTIAYAGSLVQQGHAEIVDKGILVWDLKSKTCEYVPMKNRFGFVTVEIDSNKIITPKTVIENWPHSLRLRVKHNNTNTQELNRIISAFKHRYNVIELTTQQLDIKGTARENHNVVLGDVRDVEYQNKLIIEYADKLTNSALIDKDVLRNINRAMNSKLAVTDTLIRNVVWKPKSLEFSNMFSFGEDNFYDLEKSGLHGICGSNAVGKSALLDILTFCLYDKCTRTFKSNDMMNNQKTAFSCKLVFTLGADEYVIERIGTKKKNATVKVDVNFSKIKADGTLTSLNGEERNDTNRIIRSYIGSYDDFVLTALSSQNDNKNFVFKTQSERKDLLNSFLDISIFDDLETVAKLEVKGKREYVKTLQNEINLVNTDEVISSINNIENSILVASGSCVAYKEQITQYDAKIRELSSKITDIKLLNIDDINSSKLIKSGTLIDDNKKLDVIKTTILNLIDLKKSKIDKISEFDELALQLDSSNHSKLSTQLNSNGQEQRILSGQIKSHQSQIDKLIGYKFNPDCDYCVDNEFVKSARIAQEELPTLIEQYDKLKIREGEIRIELDVLANSLEQLEILNDLKIELTENESAISIAKIEYDKCKLRIEKLEFELAELDKSIKLYKQQEEEIKANKEYQNEIDKLQIEYSNLWDLRETAQADLVTLTSRLTSLNDKYAVYLDKKGVLQEKAVEVELYDVYLQAVSKNGVPYNLLQKILPAIESEVNIILNQLVDFTLVLNTDEKSNINCYISYGDSNNWPVELASGMERFIVSIATRVALINVTSLPRPNFLAIDEGFGVLDSDNLNSLYLLFDYLKTQFDFILIITHIDAMKDFVDDMIFITKNTAGFSQIGQEQSS